MKKYKNKQWLYDQYITNKRSSMDIAKICKVSDTTILEWLKKFNIKKNRKEIYKDQNLKAQSTWFKKYKTKFPAQSQQIKEKYQKTCLEKYGVDNPTKNKTIQNKSKNTCLEKYGVDNPTKNKEIVEKAKNTKQSKSEQEKRKIQEKREKTCLEKYGHTHAAKNNEIKKKALEKFKKTWELKTKEEIDLIHYKIHQSKKKNYSHCKSKIEDKFYEYLIENIDKNTQRQVECQGFAIDFYLPGYNIYVQFDGDYWHGYLHTREELIKSKQGKTILQTMERDKKQNNLILNLVRIKESEFKGKIL